MPKDTKTTINHPSPLPKIAALKYDNKVDAAPKVTAKGKGAIAERLLEIAKENDVPIHKDGDLIEILDTVEIDTEIPLEVFAVVAEVFRYIYSVNKRKISTT